MAVNLVMKMLSPPAGSEPQFSVDIERSATVGELKEQIAGRAGLPKEQIRLVCAGRVWQDAATVGSYEPADGVIVHLLHDPPRNQPASSSQVLRPADPLSQMMADSAGDSMFGGNNFMAQSQQMMMQNPEMLQELMKMPMMKQMMSDPETVRALMRMNPQLNQLMEQRPEIARLLDDPEVFRQSMQMVANPSLMREMTRNADRAIGQLDALPGGHNALVRAHEEFADPLYQALSGSDGSGAGASAATYEDQTQGAPNNEALPNPWGAPQQPAPTTTAAAARPAASATTPAAGTAPAGLGAGLGAGGMGGLGAMGLGGTAPGGGTAGGGGSNPMAAMMQQMMSNPQQMQQMMQLSQQLMGGGAGLGGATSPGATSTAPATGTSPTGAATQPATATSTPGTTGDAQNPFMAMMQQRMAMMQGNNGTAPSTAGTGGTAPPMNPMAAAMQQLMNNPQQMQQSMMLAQQMFGGGAGMGGGGFGNTMGGNTMGGNTAATNPFANFMQNTAATQPQAGGSPQSGGADANVAQNPFLRNRFAGQLAQLREMGFENEAVCIRVLTQHNGRVDLALDTLFSMGDEAR